MKKVLVIGPGGAGKSTLANRLGDLLEINVIHLDKIYWHAGWIETPKGEWQEKVEQLVKRDAWIMDGNYSGTLDIRFKACDTVIFLDLPRTICIWRVLKRVLTHRNKTRPDMAAGCAERFKLEFISWIWNYPNRSRPKIVRIIQSENREKNVVWLRTQSEVDNFLAEQTAPSKELNTEGAANTSPACS